MCHLGNGEERVRSSPLPKRGKKTWQNIVICVLKTKQFSGELELCELEYNLGCNTRGNKYKLLNCTFCHNLRKYYFSVRVINIWNSLPNCVVDVSTINQFKARLDKFWLHQDILYDYTADMTGIGDRSVHVTKDE